MSERPKETIEDIKNLQEEVKLYQQELDAKRMLFAEDFRKEAGLNISELAEKLGVSTSYICMLEKAKQPWSQKLWDKLVDLVASTQNPA